MNYLISFLFFFQCFISTSPQAAIVDLHTHLASHIPYGFMLKGGLPTAPPAVMGETTEHTFWQQMYKDWLVKSGIKLFVNATLINIFQFSKESALKQIVEQFQYSKNFIEKYPDLFYLATSPRAAKEALANGKIVFVHALEGAEDIIETSADVLFLKNHGVSMIAPIHLVDCEYGTASILEGFKKILNPKGFLKELMGNKNRGGLTPHGKNVIEWIVKSGMIVDVAHMSRESTEDTLAIMQKLNLPLVVSHTSLTSVHYDERGLSNEQVKRIYQAGGLIGLTSGRGLIAPNRGQVLPTDYCPNSIDDYFFQYEAFHQEFPDLPLGFASDFNGFVSHMRPCPEQSHLKDLHPIKQQGLKTMKDLPLVFDYIEQKIKNGTHHLFTSAERYLEIWEKVIQFSLTVNPKN